MAELRSIRPMEVIAALQHAGGVRRTGKSDHVNLKMPNGQIITVRMHRGPVKIGLLKALLRKAGLTQVEFLRLLEG